MIRSTHRWTCLRWEKCWTSLSTVTWVLPKTVIGLSMYGVFISINILILHFVRRFRGFMTHLRTIVTESCTSHWLCLQMLTSTSKKYWKYWNPWKKDSMIRYVSYFTIYTFCIVMLSNWIYIFFYVYIITIKNIKICKRFVDFCKKELENFFLHRKNKLKSLIIFLIKISSLIPVVYWI